MRGNGLTLGDAQRAVQAAINAARRRDLAMSIAVVDAGGHEIMLLRMDGAPIVSVGFAVDKAWTAAVTEMATAELGKLSGPEGPLAGLSSAQGGRVITFGGGLPLRSSRGHHGGIGVSGGAVLEDVAVAEAAVSAWEQGVEDKAQQ